MIELVEKKDWGDFTFNIGCIYQVSLTSRGNYLKLTYIPENRLMFSGTVSGYLHSYLMVFYYLQRISKLKSFNNSKDKEKDLLLIFILSCGFEKVLHDSVF